MTHYIKTINGDVLVKVKTAKRQISVSVDIRVYSDCLMFHYGDIVQQAFISAVDTFSNLRIEYFETVGLKESETTTYFVKEKCGEFIREWPHFSYHTD